MPPRPTRIPSPSKTNSTDRIPIVESTANPDVPQLASDINALSLAESQNAHHAKDGTETTASARNTTKPDPLRSRQGATTSAFTALKPSSGDTQLKRDKVPAASLTNIGSGTSVTAQRPVHGREKNPPASSKPIETSKTTSNASRVLGNAPNIGIPSLKDSPATSGAVTSFKKPSAAGKAHQRTQSLHGPPDTTQTTPTTNPTSATPRTSGASAGQKRFSSTASRPLEQYGPNQRVSSKTSTSASRYAAPQTPGGVIGQTSSSTTRPSKQTRPAFSSYQQDFTTRPKSRPVSSSSASTATTAKRPSQTTPTPSSRAARKPSTPSTAAPTVQSPQKQKLPAPAHQLLRSQTRLLHLSLLHSQAPQTLKAYRNSAESALKSRFEALYALYTETLLLERSARQARNLRALHTWSGGNTAALSRKLSVLTGVLAELMSLTEPASTGDEDLELRPQREGQEAGSYAACVTRFEKWVAWVRSIWAARDAEAAVLKSNETPAAANNDSSDDGDEDDAPRQGKSEPILSSKTAATSSSATHVETEAPAYAAVAIEGLGDGAKAALRSLTAQLNALHIRLRDLSSPPFPDISLSFSSSSALQPSETTATATDKTKAKTNTTTMTAEPTPARVLRAATQLLDGMLEEVQVMREVEFEVVVGERAWAEERVRRIGAEIDKGYGAAGTGASKG